MSTSFTAPVGGNSNKLDVDKIPSGMQLCTFYGLVDIGTQDTSFGMKRQVNLAFEFPQEMRVFWEGDGAKPSAIFNTETLSMHEKANLRNTFIEPMSGKNFTDDEAAKFGMETLLGKHYVATIRHTPDGKYANIVAITPLDEKNKNMFGLQSLSVPQINPTIFFHLSMGFESNNFAALPKFLREKLMNSEEGKKHKASGGKFAEPVVTNGSNGSGASAPGHKKVVMHPNSQYSYEQLKGANWTDQQIVDGGHGKWDEPVAPPAPPVPPTAPPAPAKPVLVLKDQSQTIEAWHTAGWTDEMLVEHGHASFQ